ncbi:MAG: TniB family NTP-binding protein [Proteobacteria bacterium]|nr:TniB family NTP-binding protein [Pseudomonadota bacterium]
MNNLNKCNFSLRCQFISTPQAEKIFGRINEVLEDTLRSRASKGLLIVGVSGTGKTTLAREFENERFPNGRVSGKYCPLLYVEMPSSPTKKNLATAVLTALGDPFASSRGHSAEAKFSRIVTLLKNLNVQILILDEAQHLVDYKRGNEYEAADWIKSLMNETAIAVVLLGLPRTQNLLRANEQLRRRFSANVQYERFIYSGQSANDFAHLIHSISQILPIPSIDLVGNEICRRLHCGTFGLLDYLIKLIDRAVFLVQIGNVEGIDQGILAQAFIDEIWSDAPAHRNPFSEKFDFNPLIGLHEPFDNFEAK